MPEFFVPMCKPEEQEAAYAELARAAGQGIPAIGDRVYSITYSHNGEIWTATVGEQMRGYGYKSRRIRGQRIQQETPLSNRSTVLAIFPGVPYFVWHDGASNTWANPFMAGQPSSVVRFTD